MLRCGCRILLCAANKNNSNNSKNNNNNNNSNNMSATFSSAAFTGDDGGAYERFQQEQERLRSESSANSSERKSRVYTDRDRPTRAKYEGQTCEDLLVILEDRERQIRQIRAIYENFHYEADKFLRKQILDYHDKTAALSQVHGQMQQQSLSINREALTKMREEQEMLERDKRLIFFASTVFSLLFWIWIHRHYVHKKQFLAVASNEEAGALAGEHYIHNSPTHNLNVAVTGLGGYGTGAAWFSSDKRSGRNIETSWEKEVRERREEKRRKQQEEEAAAAARADDDANNASSDGSSGYTDSKKGKRKRSEESDVDPEILRALKIAEMQAKAVDESKNNASSNSQHKSWWKFW